MTTRPWLKPAEAAEILQTTKVKVNELCDNGTFRAEYLYKLGKEWRINPAAFETPPDTPDYAQDVLALERIARIVDNLQAEIDSLKRTLDQIRR